MLGVLLKQDNTVHRNDGVWGNVKRNSTHLTGTGMVGDLMTSKIDLILAPLTYTRSRSEGVKYLRPLAQEKRSLFINSDASEAAVSWLIYVKPFTMGLWLMILFLALVNAIFINFVNYIYGKRKQVQNFLTGSSLANSIYGCHYINTGFTKISRVPGTHGTCSKEDPA